MVTTSQTEEGGGHKIHLHVRENRHLEKRKRVQRTETNTYVTKRANAYTALEV